MGITCKPNEIPSEITEKVYVFYAINGYRAGDVFLSNLRYDEVGDDAADYIRLCEHAITLAIPQIDENGIKSKVLEALQGELQKVRAENHQREQAVQHKIDALLAIEYREEK